VRCLNGSAQTGTRPLPRALFGMDRIQRWLPRKPHSLTVRLAITTAMVTFSFAVVLGLQRADGLLGFYMMLPAIFAAAILFDRSAGIYATGLSTALLYVLLTPSGSVLVPRQFVLPLILYVLVALGFAIVSDALRRAWEHAAAAERAKDLLLRELGHRTKNNLAMAMSMLSMQASLKSNVETRRALEKAVARLHAIASAHEHFQPFGHRGRVEMRAYLGQLCGHLGDALRDVRPIAVKVEACELYLPSEQAVALGLIVNELVTNSLKHAFPADRAGTVRVVLSAQPDLTLLVCDDGVGCMAPVAGVGTRLVQLLAQQLGARISWGHAEPGCQVRVDLPLSATTRPGATTNSNEPRRSATSEPSASMRG
jgi:two-component system, sensor histidine kinase PdtaS